MPVISGDGYPTVTTDVPSGMGSKETGSAGRWMPGVSDGPISRTARSKSGSSTSEPDDGKVIGRFVVARDGEGIEPIGRVAGLAVVEHMVRCDQEAVVTHAEPGPK